jgi:hypothetical protein
MGCVMLENLMRNRTQRGIDLFLLVSEAIKAGPVSSVLALALIPFGSLIDCLIYITLKHENREGYRRI